MIIVGFSGKKGAGKDTAALYCYDYVTTKLSIPVERDKCFYSFADDLKWFCVHVLGLTKDQCYGSDEQKMEETPYRWEHVSDYLRWLFGKQAKRLLESGVDRAQMVHEYCALAGSGMAFGYRTGPMTAREVMQLFGTELIRDTFGNVWTYSTLRRIRAGGQQVNFITDVRFPDEVSGILDCEEGYIIRLTRSVATRDAHASETSLDRYDWSRDKCYLIDNRNMTIEEQEAALASVLNRILAHAGVLQQ